ncbi:hypothetical protein [Candidatus Poriferisocius sp.]
MTIEEPATPLYERIGRLQPGTVKQQQVRSWCRESACADPSGMLAISC